MPSKLFDVEHQLVFYGSYHVNKQNVAIHLVGVPILIWSGLVFASALPWPAAFPHTQSWTYGTFIKADLNWGATMAAAYYLYYVTLEPLTALLYLPQWALTYLTAEAFAVYPHGITIAAWLHAFAWVAQFIGHGVFERRAPALLDNLLGAVVLAPFFVHLEVLFGLGYKPEFHKRINNKVGVEIAKFRKGEAEKGRQAGAAKSSANAL